LISDMDRLTNKVQKDLIEFRRIQDTLAHYYEKAENREMAYLVRWSILERFVKAVAYEYRRESLRKSLNGWLEHVEKGKPQPSKKPNS